VLKFFSDRHRFFLLTDNTVVHKYNIHKHIPREYGQQLGSNLNVSSFRVFYGSRTSLNGSYFSLPIRSPAFLLIFATFLVINFSIFLLSVHMHIAYEPNLFRQILFLVGF